MKKEDMYKLFAIGLIVVFGVEMIALGVFNSGGSAAPAGNSGQAANGTSLDGSISDNVTIVRYEPYLIVDGNQSMAEAVAQKLISDGVATYSVPSQGSLIVNLKESRSVPSAALEFERANTTPIATAVVSTSAKLMLIGEGLSTSVEGTSFRIQIRPVYEEGAIAPARFTASAIGGVLQSLGDFSLLPLVIRGADAEAGVISMSQSEYVVEVPWQSRNGARQLASASGAAYKEKSYVLVAQNATQAQLDAMRVQPYVTGTQPGIVSVKNEFENISRASMDFTLMKLDPVFPPSAAYFANQTGNASAVSLLSGLNAAGIEGKLTTQTRVKLRLPETLEKDGANYRTDGTELTLALNDFAVNSTMLRLKLDFEAAGGRVLRITSADVAN